MARTYWLKPADSTSSLPPTAGPVRDPSALDCLIVGYYDLDIKSTEEAHMRTQYQSGAFRNFRINTLQLGGSRLPFMEVLNGAIAGATGRNPRLHVARLPNLGAAYLRSYLLTRGHAAEVVNYVNADRERLAELLDRDPVLVAITTTFYVEAAPVVELVRLVRRLSPAARIAVGGPFVYNLCSHLDEESQDAVFSEIGADFYIFEAQGEATLAALVAALKAGASVARVPNLLYPSGNDTLARTPREGENNSLDENAIDWSSFDPTFLASTVQLRTARSCAFKCSFCRYPVVAGALTLASVETVERELRQLRDAGVENVVFVDDTFNVPLPRFKELCRMMIRNQFGLSWFSYLRCSNVDDDAFELMARSGCRGVFLGIESADPHVLATMNKAATVDRYRYGIRRLKEHGIFSFASLIVGFPGETSDSVQRTMDFIEETRPDCYRAELYYHDPNTPIGSRSRELGLSGAGYSWRHATMNWEQACDHVDSIYRRIEGSLILPLYMFDFWSIPYLNGCGITIDALKEFLAVTQQMLKAQLAVSPLQVVEDDERALLGAVRRFAGVRA